MDAVISRGLACRSEVIWTMNLSYPIKQSPRTPEHSSPTGYEGV